MTSYYKAIIALSDTGPAKLVGIKRYGRIGNRIRTWLSRLATPVPVNGDMVVVNVPLVVVYNTATTLLHGENELVRSGQGFAIVTDHSDKMAIMSDRHRDSDVL